MHRKTRKLLAVCLTFAVLHVSAFQSVASASTLLEGNDRYATALKIVQAGWEKSDDAIIARGDDLADALAAAPLAYAKGKAPILLTSPSKLPAGVMEELKTLGVKNIYIVGGVGAVSTAVENDLKGFTIKRITGKDRVETSYNLALEAFPVAPTEVILANGLAYADALSISAIAAVKGMPILLVNNNKLTANEKTYIAGKTVYAVGGMGVLNPKIESAANVIRLAGDNRYETNAEILKQFKPDYSKIYLANGTNPHLVDALTGSALAAKTNSPVVLVDGNSTINTKLLGVVQASIREDSQEIILGGTVAQSAADAIETLKPHLSLNKTTDNLTVGDTDNLIATITPSNTTINSAIWTTSNPEVADVINGAVTAVGLGTAVITVSTEDGNKTAKCTVIVSNKKGYVYNPELKIDLKVRSAPNSTATILGNLYNYEKVEIMGTADANAPGWYKINYKTSNGYVSDAYIQLYNSPPADVVNIAKNISEQFETGNNNQIAGNFDKQGLSLGYLQWNIAMGTLQPLLNRMDRQYPDEMKTIFGAKYDVISEVITDYTLDKQLIWARSINNSKNEIIEPWNSAFQNLCDSKNFKSIEADSEVYMIKQAMNICEKYNLKTIRGFALAFDVVLQNGSISSDAIKSIDAAGSQTTNMTEKALLSVIANAVADSSVNSEDIRSRKMAIVNGKGMVHGIMLNLDTNYGLSDANWR